MSVGVEKPPLDESSRSRLDDALRRVRQGLSSGMDDLRRILDERPELWAEAGDLAAHAERAWIERIAPRDPLIRASLERKVAAMRVDLAGPEPAPLVRLLAARVALTWLQAHHADLVVAQNGDVEPSLLDQLTKRADAAARKFSQASAALANTRRLLSLAANRESLAAREELAVFPTEEVPDVASKPCRRRR